MAVIKLYKHDTFGYTQPSAFDYLFVESVSINCPKPYVKTIGTDGKLSKKISGFVDATITISGLMKTTTTHSTWGKLMKDAAASTDSTGSLNSVDITYGNVTYHNCDCVSSTLQQIPEAACAFQGSLTWRCTHIS